MGKKYDAYVKAVQANNEAKGRVHEVSGGSTRDTMNEALTNQQQAQRAEDDAWARVIEDPQG